MAKESSSGEGGPMPKAGESPYTAAESEKLAPPLAIFRRFREIDLAYGRAYQTATADAQRGYGELESKRTEIFQALQDECRQRTNTFYQDYAITSQASQAGGNSADAQQRRYLAFTSYLKDVGAVEREMWARATDVESKFTEDLNKLSQACEEAHRKAFADYLLDSQDAWRRLDIAGVIDAYAAARILR